MAISDAVQTLSAAFSFGILLQAATGALFVYYRGHGSTIFQDGRRLVLVLFLLFAALWAQIDFVNLLLPATMATGCQATLIITTMFDQLARVGMEQFLLWSVGHGTRLTVERLILQGVLLARLVAGGLLVGFTRPQFEPVCVAQTSVTPIAIVVLALDAIIVGVLLVRAASLGMFRDMGGKDGEQSKALVLSIFGFAFWTAISVPMILGIPTIILLLRTVLPANGLLVLVGIVTMFPHALLSDREQITTPEASSPFVQPMPPSRQIFRGSINNDGSPISNHNYTKSGSLFVVNPSATPRDSPRGVFSNSPRGDTRGFTKMNEEVSVRDLGDAPERPDRPERSGPGYRGSSGVFPSVLSAPTASALAPQIRPNITVNTKVISGPMNLGPSPAQQKRGLFNFNKTPTKPSIRSLGISQPVTSDTDSGAQPFARMQTIDLATAALNERERRDGAAARAKLVANRPAPQPPTMSSQDALRKSVSVKRKQMPGQAPDVMPTIPGSVTSSRDAEVGSTTSASLSPGREEVRRRSPRQNNGFHTMPVIDAKTGKPTQLQRKNTLGGLPSNPRATRIMNLAPEPPKMAVPQQTVMFMNDIVYDNPGVVKTIIRDAPGMYAKRPKTAGKGSIDSTSSLHSAGSIIHRPRPYKRDQSKDRAIFPSEPSPGHRRSRSGSSITPRRSIFQSNPGSPTMLPPLPPPPTTAAGLKRLLPNDTKSMTFDEKIELLFPAPPGGSSTLQRRSSVPSLPRVPSVFMSESPQAQSPTEEEAAARRQSKRTTIAAFLHDAVPPPIPAKSPKRESIKAEKSRQTYRFSANTYRTIADEVGETWIPGIPAHAVEPRNALLGVPQRQSVLDDVRKSHFTITTDANSEDDSTTYWGSVHDDVPAVHISGARQNARSTFIKPYDSKKSSTVPSIHTVNSDDAREGEEIMTVMLASETEETRKSFLLENDNNRRSFFLDAGETLPGDKTPSSIKENGWHRRIGDELPTFSERKEMRKSRKMPPPTPLLLNNNGRKATVVVRVAEPSPPVDSPERAIAEIQAQLKRFEEPSRGSVGSLLRGLPGGENTAPGNDRLRLLENLEAEMGQQENAWQQMQNNLDRDSMMSRDSMSQIVSPQPETISEGTDLSRESSQRSSHTPFRVLSKRARIRSGTSDRKSHMSSLTNSTESSDNSRASVWQKRLADAQMEYTENAPELLMKRSLNFLSVSKSHQLGSPTPPDSGESETDMETDAESESEMEAARYQELLQAPHKEHASLWQQPLVTPKATVGRMWNSPFETIKVRSASPEPPAKNLRPAQRRTETVLPIMSTDLWEKPRTAPNKRPVVALWGSKLVRPVSIVTRRVTQRPQRKSKRVTFLPDIVESPSPLPNKRDTLGIFQFPWGEKSDQPVYQPAFNLALLAGPALNAKLDARARQLENSEQAEYSSSFFDDYDEDQDEMDPESDDDFDETTLWEIASLLQSKDVPSKQSILGPGRSESILQDFEEEPDSDNAVPVPVMPLPIRPLVMTARPSSQLWAAENAFANVAVSNGLPQPEPQVWNALIPASDDIVRSKARVPTILPMLASKDLWTSSESGKSSPVSWIMLQSGKASKKATSLSSSPMWSPKPEATPTRESGLFTPTEGLVIRTTGASPAALKMAKAPRPSATVAPSISSRNLWTQIQNMEEATNWLSKSSKNSPQPARSQEMWSPAPQVLDVHVVGLFDASIPRSVYRTSDATPAAINMTTKPRTSKSPLSELTSTKLWSCCGKLPIERDWISESSIRPESPSIYSTSSSGSSSPTSDSSSVKSTSTKASSLWGSVSAFKIPTWWTTKDKGPKNPADPSPIDDSKPASKIPVRQGTPLAPVRESRVLASRDMWEAKAPILEKTPIRGFGSRRATVAQGPVTAPHRALRHQYKPTVIAFRANWDDALAEAIAAGTPKRSLPRPITRKSDWESALAEAVKSSKPRLQRPRCSKAMWADALAEAVSKSRIPRPVKVQRYDPSVLHPVFFTKSLSTSAKDVHPAAMGHVASKYDPSVLHPVFFTQSLQTNVKDIHPAAIGRVSKKYDPSILHPVFFTESRTSTTYDVHPAAIGHISKVTRPSMWASSSARATPKAASLWSKDTVLPRKSTDEASIIAGPVRKASVPRSVELPVLESKACWQPSNTASVERNWIASTVVESPKTWTPRSQSPLREQGNSSMWSAPAISLPALPSMFSHIKNDLVRKAPVARSVELPVLESKAFWQPAKIISVERNWISSAPSSLTRANPPKTWTPRRQSPLQTQDSMKMWAAKASSAPSSPDMFAHMNSGLVRKATVEKGLDLPILESKNFWQATKSVSAERNWISATVFQSPKTWSPSAKSSDSQVKDSDSMWTANATSSPTSPDLFAHVKGGLVKKSSPSRPSALPRLNSSELFGNGSTTSQPKNIHWLHTTSTRTTKSAARALTWTAPSVQATLPATATQMWEVRSEISLPSPTLFENPHNQPWNPKKRDEASLSELESAELWRPSMTQPESPINWLVKRRFSRVEFRY
ncbi:hypothetical protein BDZ45DRAFT_667000 [Acephala macrosclerotiorum]|nr:hypothetical protein BDZ45DRAFT_667000 [Acephala macrosclerotiorum]